MYHPREEEDEDTHSHRNPQEEESDDDSSINSLDSELFEDTPRTRRYRERLEVQSQQLAVQRAVAALEREERQQAEAAERVRVLTGHLEAVTQYLDSIEEVPLPIQFYQWHSQEEAFTYQDILAEHEERESEEESPDSQYQIEEGDILTPAYYISEAARVQFYNQRDVSVYLLPEELYDTYFSRHFRQIVQRGRQVPPSGRPITDEEELELQSEELFFEHKRAILLQQVIKAIIEVGGGSFVNLSS